MVPKGAGCDALGQAHDLHKVSHFNLVSVCMNECVYVVRVCDKEKARKQISRIREREDLATR